MKAKLIILVILLVPVGIFVYQNMAPVTITFINWSFDLPQALLLLSVLVFGFFLGMLQMFLRARKKKKKQKAAQPAAGSASATVTTDHVTNAEAIEPEATTTTADSSHPETGARS